MKDFIAVARQLGAIVFPRTGQSSPTRRPELEQNLQAKLDRAITPRPDYWVPDIDIGRCASTAEYTARHATELGIDVSVSGMVEEVENLRSKLSVQSVPLDRKVLDQREIPILEGQPGEDVGPAGSECAKRRRDENRIARGEATEIVECCSRPPCDSSVQSQRLRRTSPVGGTREEWDALARQLAKVRRISEEVPAVGEFPSPGDIIQAVARGVRATALHGHNRIDLPAIQQVVEGLHRRRNVVGQCQSPAISNIERQVRIFGFWIEAVLRQQTTRTDVGVRPAG